MLVCLLVTPYADAYLAVAHRILLSAYLIHCLCWQVFVGRTAQLGFLAAVIGEKITGKGILRQIGLETGALVHCGWPGFDATSCEHWRRSMQVVNPSQLKHGCMLAAQASPLGRHLFSWLRSSRSSSSLRSSMATTASQP